MLILADGTKLYDSRVIVEYLDAQAGGYRLIPVEPAARWRVLTTAALADGSTMPRCCRSMRSVSGRRNCSRRRGGSPGRKVTRGLAAFAAAPPSGARDIAHIGLACALGYLDLRFAGAWRDKHPVLVAWLDAFAADVPAFAATR